MLLQGHQPLLAALKALRDAYGHLQAGGSAAELKSRIVSSADLEALLQDDRYKELRAKYLRQA